MRARNIALVGVLVLAVGAAIYGWYRVIFRPQPTACGYCSRPLHANLSVVAEIDGKRAKVCCAQCAITEANQLHKPVKLIEVHDYPSGKSIAPEHAWYVSGSRAMACNHDMMHMGEMKDMQDLAFDRCSPGIFSFANRSDAEAFSTKNGGMVLSFAQLMSEARFQ